MVAVGDCVNRSTLDGFPDNGFGIGLTIPDFSTRYKTGICAASFRYADSFSALETTHFMWSNSFFGIIGCCCDTASNISR